MRLALYLLSVTGFGLVLAAAVEALTGSSLGLEYHKLVFRSLELGGLVCAFVWLRLVGARGLAAWGLYPPLAARLGEGGQGLLFGVSTLGVVVAGLLAAGVRVPGDFPGAAAVPVLVARGLLLGLAVATVEELWYRGALYTALAAPAGRHAWRAVWSTSVLFAALHFVRPDQPVLTGEVRWWSGLTVLAGSFGRFGGPSIVDSGAALLAAGVLLALMRMRTGGIAACIGVHAGWVAVIYVARELTVLQPRHAAAVLAGSYDGVVGWLAAVVFVVAAAVLYGRPPDVTGGPPRAEGRSEG